jgi:hypothetical protein
MNRHFPRMKEDDHSIKSDPPVFSVAGGNQIYLYLMLTCSQVNVLCECRKRKPWVSFQASGVPYRHPVDTSHVVKTLRRLSISTLYVLWSK